MRMRELVPLLILLTHAGCSKSTTGDAASGGTGSDTGLQGPAQTLAIHPSGRFVYALRVQNDRGKTTLESYAADPDTGVLTSIASSSEVEFPAAVTVSPAGDSLYVGSDDMFKQLSVLPLPSGTGVPGAARSMDDRKDVRLLFLEVAADGRFVYGSSTRLGSVGTFATGAGDDGRGLPRLLESIRTGTAPARLALHPNGKFGYLANYEDGILSVFRVDPVTGSLSESSRVEHGAKMGPTIVALSPEGSHAFVLNYLASSISIYAVHADTGALTLLRTTEPGNRPSYLALSPDGRFAYVTEENFSSVAVYGVDLETGELTSLQNRGTGPHPNSIAIDPTGKFAYVLSAGQTLLHVYRIGQDGKLSLLNVY